MVGTDQLGFCIGKLAERLIETIRRPQCVIDLLLLCYNSINFYEGST